MTGIPEDITDATRKRVTDLCIKQPHQRMSEGAEPYRVDASHRKWQRKW